MFQAFEEIGAIEALKQVASYPEEVGPKYAAQALEIIGAEIPYKLIQQVPLWTVEDVQYWVSQVIIIKILTSSLCILLYCFFCTTAFCMRANI